MTNVNYFYANFSPSLIGLISITMKVVYLLSSHTQWNGWTLENVFFDMEVVPSSYGQVCDHKETRMIGISNIYTYFGFPGLAKSIQSMS